MPSGNRRYEAGSEADKHEELRLLREENARLKILLDRHGIPWDKELPVKKEALGEISESLGQQFSINEKVALVGRLFRGRSDVYPLRWESAKGKSGYSPACANEWQSGICGKPKVKCGECDQRQFLPVTDKVIYDHLAGKHTVGVYPLLADETCCFLAVDFDEADWREDVCAFMHSCREFQIPAALEISRSGEGAHIWIFFADPVPAGQARRLGASLISRTCDRLRQLALSSYDRCFPNQDTLPKGGFGNLIALPLQKQPREKGRSVFVDENLSPYLDQWAFLASIRSMSGSELERTIQKVSDGRHPLDVAFAIDEEETTPWERPMPLLCRLSGPLPESLTLMLANQIFIPKADLPPSLANRLIRLAAFQNPEFYKAQAMRLPVWNKPRIIGCADNFPQHIALPRGCLENVLDLLDKNGIRVEMRDRRTTGHPVRIKFTGVLRDDQMMAVEAMINQDIGVLCTPTAFGKTVTAAAIIAHRKVSTLILVHRTELLRQWRERLTSFLDFSVGDLGQIGGGRYKPTGKIDIAVMQSLSRNNDSTDLLDGYGQVIVDECHHLSAFSFESVLKRVKAKYVLGLTATPVRRDGHHPIIFMQCGPIRHSAAKPDTAPALLEVWPQILPVPEIPPESSIQDIFRILARDAGRIERIAQDILNAYQEGRKILVLTERTEHLELLRKALGEKIGSCFVLHGRLSRKQRAEILTGLEKMDSSAPCVLMATGRLIGEGFDHPPLDTLVLAMPISWKGTLQQYAGRLHREHAGKQDVRIYDYIDHNQQQLLRMWEKRQRGYRAMGYQIQHGNDCERGDSETVDSIPSLGA